MHKIYLFITLYFIGFSCAQVLDPLPNAKAREIRGHSYEGFKGKPDSVEADSEEAKEVAEVIRS
jgi:hypothetical protein